MNEGALVVSGVPVLGVALAAVLERCGYRVLGRVGCSAELAAAVRTATPALLVVDLDAPHVVPAVRRTCAGPTAPAVLLLAGDEHDDDIVSLVCAGALGAVPRGVAPETLERVLAAIKDGESIVPRHLVARVMDELRRRMAVDGESQIPILTRREQQILDMMRSGLTTAAIANRLVVAPVTVRSHVSAIRRKLRPGAGVGEGYAPAG